MTELPSEVVIGGFAAMGGAIVWLAHKWDTGNNRCEERSNALQDELRELRDWARDTLTKLVLDNAHALDRNTLALTKLKHEVRDNIDPTDHSPASDTESDLHRSLTVQERAFIGRPLDETEVLRRK